MQKRHLTLQAIYLIVTCATLVACGGEPSNKNELTSTLADATDQKQGATKWSPSKRIPHSDSAPTKDNSNQKNHSEKEEQDDGKHSNDNPAANKTNPHAQVTAGEFKHCSQITSNEDCLADSKCALKEVSRAIYYSTSQTCTPIDTQYQFCFPANLVSQDIFPTQFFKQGNNQYEVFQANFRFDVNLLSSSGYNSFLWVKGAEFIAAQNCLNP